MYIWSEFLVKCKLVSDFWNLIRLWYWKWTLWGIQRLYIPLPFKKQKKIKANFSTQTEVLTRRNNLCWHGTLCYASVLLLQVIRLWLSEIKSNPAPDDHQIGYYNLLSHIRLVRLSSLVGESWLWGLN